MPGFLSYVSELFEETFLPTVAYAEDEEEKSEEPDAEEEHEDESTDDKEDEDDGDEEEEDEDDDDEDEDEPEDVYPGLREAAAEGKCHNFKHHFDECVERVTAEQQEEGYKDKEYKEDCVEEL